jgi:DNA-binding HxlR family transcriptional regulator
MEPRAPTEAARLTNREPTRNRRVAPVAESHPGSTVSALSDEPATIGDCFNVRCPGRAVLAHVTGRWGSLVIGALNAGRVMRFSELRDRIDGISEKMLAQTLRELERDGLLERTSRPVVPPYVDYRLTPLGAGVAPHVAGLVSWIDHHVHDIVVAQLRHDKARVNL